MVDILRLKQLLESHLVSTSIMGYALVEGSQTLINKDCVEINELLKRIEISNQVSKELLKEKPEQVVLEEGDYIFIIYPIKEDWYLIIKTTPAHHKEVDVQIAGLLRSIEQMLG